MRIGEPFPDGTKGKGLLFLILSKEHGAGHTIAFLGFITADHSYHLVVKGLSANFILVPCSLQYEPGKGRQCLGLAGQV